MKIGLYLVIIVACLAFWIWLIGRFVSTKKKRDALHESASKKSCEEWTEQERNEEIFRITLMHNAGKLTNAEFLALKAKYSGKELTPFERETILAMRENELMGKK